jgi:hypothetical protein
VNDLLELWFQMANLLIVIDIDPSYYLVFRGALTKWLERYKRLPLSWISGYVSMTAQSLGKFAVGSTGLSLSLIWTVAHPIVPRTLSEWDTFNRFLDFIRDFDTKVGSGPGNSSCLSVYI